MTSLQVVIDPDNFDSKTINGLNTGASLWVSGSLVVSLGGGQKTEISANEIRIIGNSNPEELQKTILQPKKHSLEKLREQGHLRMRTNLFGAVFRIRHHMSFRHS